MHKNMKKMTFLAVAAILLFSACGPSEADLNATAQAQELEINTIRETAIAEEIAKVTQTAAAMPPTETPIPPRPTDTQAPLPTEPAAGVPTLPQQSAPTNPPPTGGEVAALASETIPDGTVMDPGESFTKTWTLQNIGKSTWSTEYALVYLKGTQMSEKAVVYLPVPVAPGTLVDISIPMTAPSRVGTHQSDWMLQNTNGQKFGVGTDGSGPIWVKIVVASEPTVAAE